MLSSLNKKVEEGNKFTSAIVKTPNIGAGEVFLEIALLFRAYRMRVIHIYLQLTIHCFKAQSCYSSHEFINQSLGCLILINCKILL